MARLVAFLRAVNVGGTGLVAMAELSRRCERLGYENVKTFLNSGNVAFDTVETEAAATKRLTAMLKAWLDWDVVVMVRSLKRLTALVGRDPFKKRITETTRGYVAFLARAPTEVTAPVTFARDGLELFELDGREALVCSCEVKRGPGLLSLEGTLGPATVRNWNSVCRIVGRKPAPG